MAKFKCWCPDDGDEQSAGDVDAYDAETAAENFAERVYYGGDHTSEIEVNVRDEAGTLRNYTVDVDFDVTFSAYENKT